MIHYKDKKLRRQILRLKWENIKLKSELIELMYEAAHPGILDEVEELEDQGPNAKGEQPENVDG